MPLTIQTLKDQKIAARLFVLLAVFCLSVWGCASRGPLTIRDANYPADKMDARSLFLENCAICHGVNGRAHTLHGRLVGAQNLTNAKWQSETTDAQIIHGVKTGPSVMPAFARKLSSSEIDALAAYVRSFKQTP